MESIILLVIASIIGYFLKNKEEPTNTPPPIDRRKQRTEPRKIEQTMRRKLAEASKNVIQDVEKRIPESGELRKQATDMLRQQERHIEKNVFDHYDKTSYNRADIIQSVAKKQVQKENNNNQTNGFKFPQTSNELAQAMVMAEILGPPKSKK